MSRIQHTIVRGFASNATASRLIAGMGNQAPHVARQTVVDLRIHAGEQVSEWVATEGFRVGKVRIEVGQTYYLAASKTAHLFYIVTQDASTGEWVCSYDGSDMRFINRVRAFVAQINAA